MVKKIQKSIYIVRSSIPALSSISLSSALDLQTLLSTHYASVYVYTVDTIDQLDNLVLSRPDLVFSGLKSIPATSLHEEIWIGDYLDNHNIIYTGSDGEASKLETHKQAAKMRVLDAGLHTSAFTVVSSGTPLSEDHTLRYPLFIKPTSKGGGAGIDESSFAHNFREASLKIDRLSETYHSNTLVEEYLPGREFSVAILKNQGDYLVMPLELVAPLNKSNQRFLSAEIKRADTESFIAVTDLPLRIEVGDLALNVFHALGARDYGRIDIRLDTNGKANFLEANLIPSLLNNYGNFPKACLINEGMSHEATILHIVDLAFMRAEVATEEEVQLNAPVLLPILV